MTSSLKQTYHSLLAEAHLQPDEAQSRVVEHLSRLQQGWAEAQTAEKSGLLWRLMAKESDKVAQGVYLWGDVGRGKSLLMDLCFETTPVAPKRRVHFHAFMGDVHSRIHRWRQENAEDAKRKDPIVPVAEELAAGARLLCLDELQVHDVADAMILGRLFAHLFKLGVLVVFTSNRKPDDLYLHGLQRDRFLKFVALVKERFDVLELASAEDYRLKQLRAMEQVYMVAKPKAAKTMMDAAFAGLTHGAQGQPVTLEVQGHGFTIPQAYGDVARLSFEEVCGKALGAMDYLELAQAFNTVLIDDIPLLKPEKRNEAKRFVTLIDTLYEHKVKLVCSAAASPSKLYPKGDGSFEFARTASRLHEMQSQTYLAAAHRVA